MSWMDWHFHFIYFHVNWKFARKKLSLVKQNIVRHMASCTNFKRFSGIVYSAFNVHDLIRWNDLNSKWASIKIIDNVQMYTKTVIDWLHGDEEGEKKKEICSNFSFGPWSIGFSFGNEIGLSKMNVFGICDNVQTQIAQDIRIRMSGVNNLQLFMYQRDGRWKWLVYKIRLRHVIHATYVHILHKI